MTNKIYDSHLEQMVAEAVPNLTRIPSRVKPSVIHYTTTHAYNPDFKIVHNGMTLFIEVKGKLWKDDVQKFNALRSSMSGILLFVLQNPFQRYAPRSTTTISEWLERKGYAWCTVPNLQERIEQWKLTGQL